MMTYDELIEYNKDRKIFQIGVIVPDLDKALEAWTELYKVGPWTIYRHSNEYLQDIDIKESACKEKFAFRCALAMVGAVQIELIQPLYGMPIFEDFLAKTGGGIQHFKEIVPDDRIKAELDYYKNLDMENIYGAFFYDASFFYPDTSKYLNVQIELGNGKAANLPLDYPNKSVYPPK
jgi:hypothetical protein